MLAATTGCAASLWSVERTHEGQPLPDRYIDERAYALYAKAALAEAQGDRQAALELYALALEEDPDAPEILVRLAALACGASPARAEALFRRAARDAPEWAGVPHERARCRLARGELAGATADAERALALDPRSIEIALSLAEIHERAGRAALAGDHLDAIVTQWPHVRSTWEALLAFAERRDDPARRVRARAALLAVGRRATRAPAEATPLDAVDQATGADELATAARQARLHPAVAALRAAALGHHEAALAVAERVLGADPTNGDAWVARMLAAEGLGDRARLGAAAIADVELVAPGPLGARLLTELLARRISPEAARAWRDAAAALPPAADPLEREIDARLAAALGS
ncbi:MAG: hypothetical protein IT376_06755 [Polyangiaceae bacterium]|nr:hypothetical protein [Polyangiaceae bacterium]